MPIRWCTRDGAGADGVSICPLMLMMLVFVVAMTTTSMANKQTPGFFMSVHPPPGRDTGSLPQMLLRAGGRFPLRLAYQMGQWAENLHKRVGMVGIEEGLQEQGHDIVRPR